jgi:hypothetical protein
MTTADIPASSIAIAPTVVRILKSCVWNGQQAKVSSGPCTGDKGINYGLVSFRNQTLRVCRTHEYRRCPMHRDC